MGAVFLSYLLGGFKGAIRSIKRQGGNDCRHGFSIAEDGKRRSGLDVVAVKIAEGQRAFPRGGQHGARNHAELFLLQTNHAAPRRRLISFKDQANQLLIDVAARTDPFHHLLAQVAALVKAHGTVETGFQQKIFFVHIDAVARDPRLYAEDFLSLGADPA